MKQWFYLVHLLCSFILFSYTHQVHAELSAVSVNEIREPRKIDINTADVSLLSQSFKGIGEKRAQAIVQYREANGFFKSIEELGKVKGIGQKFIKRNAAALKETFTVS